MQPKVPDPAVPSVALVALVLFSVWLLVSLSSLLASAWGAFVVPVDEELPAKGNEAVAPLRQKWRSSCFVARALSCKAASRTALLRSVKSSSNSQGEAQPAIGHFTRSFARKPRTLGKTKSIVLDFASSCTRRTAWLISSWKSTAKATPGKPECVLWLIWRILVVRTPSIEASIRDQLPGFDMLRWHEALANIGKCRDRAAWTKLEFKSGSVCSRTSKDGCRMQFT